MNKLKDKMIFIAIFCILLFGCVMLMLYGSGRGILLDIEISGCKIQLDDTIQEVYDNGLVLCKVDGTIIDLDSCEEMKGRTYEIKTLDIGVPADDGKKAIPSGMTVYTYNDFITSQPLAKCKIYHMHVSDNHSDEVSITVNGKDIFQTELSEFVSHLEELGISFDEDEKSEFLDSYTNKFLMKRQGNFMYHLNSGRKSVNYPDPNDFFDKDRNYDNKAYEAACEEAEKNAGFGITEFEYEKLIEKSYK